MLIFNTFMACVIYYFSVLLAGKGHVYGIVKCAEHTLMTDTKLTAILLKLVND